MMFYTSQTSAIARYKNLQVKIIFLTLVKLFISKTSGQKNSNRYFQLLRHCCVGVLVMENMVLYRLRKITPQHKSVFTLKFKT